MAALAAAPPRSPLAAFTAASTPGITACAVAPAPAAMLAMRPLRCSTRALPTDVPGMPWGTTFSNAPCLMVSLASRRPVSALVPLPMASRCETAAPGERSAMVATARPTSGAVARTKRSRSAGSAMPAAVVAMSLSTVARWSFGRAKLPAFIASACSRGSFSCASMPAKRSPNAVACARCCGVGSVGDALASSASVGALTSGSAGSLRTALRSRPRAAVAVRPRSLLADAAATTSRVSAATSVATVGVTCCACCCAWACCTARWLRAASLAEDEMGSVMGGVIDDHSGLFRRAVTWARARSSTQ